MLLHYDNKTTFFEVLTLVYSLCKQAQLLLTACQPVYDQCVLAYTLIIGLKMTF